jgi:serine/threonine protein kinase
LFLISSQPAPTLKDADTWTDDFNDFLARCLHLEPSERWSAAKLLEHPFLKQEGVEDTSFLVDMLQEFKIAH